MLGNWTRGTAGNPLLFLEMGETAGSGGQGAGNVRSEKAILATVPMFSIFLLVPFCCCKLYFLLAHLNFENQNLCISKLCCKSLLALKYVVGNLLA